MLGGVTGVLVFIIILLNVYIVWLHKRGTRRGKRPYEVPVEDRGVYDNEIAVDEVTPTRVHPSSSTQQLTLQSDPAYMDLKEARPTNPQQPSLSQGADYAPLNPRTRSWEVARNQVTIEKIIGKGAFGQVAKGTAIDLPGRPGKTTVAVKMLKS